MFLQLCNRLMQVLVHSLLCDIQLCGYLFVRLSLIVTHAEHSLGLLSEFCLNEMAQFSVSFLFHCVREINDGVFYRDEALYFLSYLLMGDEVHASVSDSCQQITICDFRFRQLVVLYQSGEHVAYGILTLLVIMQQYLSKLVHACVIGSEKSFYESLFLTHVYLLYGRRVKKLPP